VLHGRCPRERPFQDLGRVGLKMLLRLGLVRGFADADVDVVGGVGGEDDGGRGLGGLAGDLLGSVRLVLSCLESDQAADQPDVFPLCDRGGGHSCWCVDKIQLANLRL